ncbi:MAG: hypothetical protein ABSB12_02030 [Candidatus Saccharimonadales bacterium]|jgi:hypothetical protein
MHDDVKQFVNRILSINAPIINMFGHGMTGMAGSAAIEQTIGTSGNDITGQLKKTALLLLKISYKNNALTGDMLVCAKKIEGLLRTEQVIQVISQKQCDQLIDELYNLVDKYQF